MKRFFIFSNEQESPTDGVIIRGAHNLLAELYPGSSFVALGKRTRRDSALLSLDDFPSPTEIDAVVFPGSPFVWDQFYDSPKIKNALLCKEVFKDKAIIWLGIGGCFPLNNERIAFNRRHYRACKEVFDKDLVITRDHLAHELLNKANINNTLLPCPAFLSLTGDYEKRDGNKALLVWHEPRTGISYGDWKSFRKLDEYYQQLTSFYTEYSPDVVCKDITEIKYAEQLGIHNVRVLKDVQDTLDTVINYDIMLSGRVHVAVPAIQAGLKVRLVPTDTRHLTIPSANTLVHRQVNRVALIERYKEVFNGYIRI